jgi:malic enzyme
MCGSPEAMMDHQRQVRRRKTTWQAEASTNRRSSSTAIPVRASSRSRPPSRSATSATWRSAYSPGVAAPCLAIRDNPETAADYTSRANLVAVISNGTAVLGLGNIGPLASKPVMEGKAVLFKKFANIDVFDIEVDANSVEQMVSTVASLEPTFGGINLEDIKAPECFEIERQLRER